MPSYWGYLQQKDKITCQYCIRESTYEITCEGSEPCSLVAHKFETEQEKKIFQKNHCMKDREKCLNGRELDKIYKIMGN